MLVGDGKPKPAGHITYRAVLPTSEMPEQYRWRDMVLWAGEKVHLVHYPLRTGELFNLVAVFHSNRYEEGWDSFGDPAELHERFAKTCEPVRTLLNKIESWRMWVLCDRPPIKEWSRGRITLLGDAAHPMLQYLAQGAGMSIEDAVCLADKVVAANGDYAAAFRAYQAARYLRTGRVQIMARVYGEFYHASGVAKELRNMMLSSRTRRRRHGRHGMALRRAEGVDAGGVIRPQERITEPLPYAARRLGRRTALTFPLPSPPQKNRSPPSDSSPDTLTPGGISRLSSTSPVCGSTRRKSLSSPSKVACQSSPSTQVTPVTKRLDSMVRRTAPVSGSI